MALKGKKYKLKSKSSLRFTLFYFIMVKTILLQVFCMNEIVKYNNQMNEVNFKDFNTTELDLLMTICSKMREQGLKIIEFSFEQLKKYLIMTLNKVIKSL